jgi:hypothetical protein
VRYGTHGRAEDFLRNITMPSHSLTWVAFSAYTELDRVAHITDAADWANYISGHEQGCLAWHETGHSRLVNGDETVIGRNWEGK